MMWIAQMWCKLIYRRPFDNKGDSDRIERQFLWIMTSISFTFLCPAIHCLETYFYPPAMNVPQHQIKQLKKPFPTWIYSSKYCSQQQQQQSIKESSVAAIKPKWLLFNPNYLQSAILSSPTSHAMALPDIVQNIRQLIYRINPRTLFGRYQI